MEGAAPPVAPVIRGPQRAPRPPQAVMCYKYTKAIQPHDVPLCGVEANLPVTHTGTAAAVTNLRDLHVPCPTSQH